LPRLVPPASPRRQAIPGNGASGRRPSLSFPGYSPGRLSSMMAKGAAPRRADGRRSFTPRSFAEGGRMYQQNYNPLGSVFLSTVMAAVPILTLLYFIALPPHRDRLGRRHLGISAPYAALFGVIAAFAVACLPFHMPLASAVSAFALGSLSGFLGII